MSLATNIALRNQQSPIWVVKIDSTPATYYSTLPVTGLSGEIAAIDKVSFPSKSVKLTGGGATVTTMTFTVLDVLLGDSTYAGSKNFHDTAIIGMPVTLFLGYQADTWDGDTTQTAFGPRWRGYIKEATYSEGKWSVKCENVLSKAKGVRALIGEGWLKVKSQYFSKDDYMAIRCRVNFPAISAPTNLLTDASWETGTASWTAGANTTSYTRGTTNPAPQTGSYRAAFQSTTNSTLASIYQDVTLPAGHKPGMVYSCAAYMRRAAAAGLIHGRVIMYGIDNSGNQYEIAYGQARKLKNDGWGRHSTSIAIWHPSTTKIRVVIAGTPASSSDPIYVDNVLMGYTPYVAAIKRELLPIISVDETTSPCQMVVAHSLAGTRENNQAKGQKGALCKPLIGYAGDILLRLLTGTSAGGNGSWDHGDGFGAGIPVAAIDTATFTATRTVTNLGAAYKLCLTVDKDQNDLLDYIEKEILIPCGMWLYEGNDGKLKLKFLPEVGTLSPDAAKALTDVKRAGRPTIERRMKDVITQVNFLADYDGQEATSTPESPEFTNKKRRKQIPDRVLKDAGESACIGRWLFDERDYRATGSPVTTGGLGDSAKTLQTRFGLEEVTIKSHGIRSHVSYAAGIPCPLEYDIGSVTGEKTFKGERAGRLMAQRLLGWFASPPVVIKWPGFSDLMQYEIGDQLTVTSSDLPDLSDTGGGMGISAVQAIVTGVSVDADKLTGTVELFLAGWAKALAQSVWSAGAVNPSVSTILVEPISLNSVESGNYPWMLEGTYNALRVVQTYDGNPGSVPTAANYWYTEVRINWAPSDANGPGYVTVARFNTGRYLIALDGVYSIDTTSLEAVNAQVYYRWLDGSYSSAYTITGISCDPTASAIATPSLTLVEQKRLRNVYTASWTENRDLRKLKVFKRAYSATPGTPETDAANWKLTQGIDLVDVWIDGGSNVELCLKTEAQFGCNHADGERICVAIQLVDEYQNKSAFYVLSDSSAPSDSDDTAPAVPTLSLASVVNDKTGTVKKECDLTVTTTWTGCHAIDLEVIEYDPSTSAVVNRAKTHHAVKDGSSPTVTKFKRLGEKGNTFYVRVRGKVGTAYSAWSCLDGGGAWDALPPVGAYSIAAGGASPLVTAPTATPASGPTPLTVAFAANASGGTAPYTYDWNYGDGSTHGNTATPSKVYTTGSYSAVLTVTDAAGNVVLAPALTILVTPSVAWSVVFPCTCELSAALSGSVATTHYLSVTMPSMCELTGTLSVTPIGGQDTGFIRPNSGSDAYGTSTIRWKNVGGTNDVTLFYDSDDTSYDQAQLTTTAGSRKVRLTWAGGTNTPVPAGKTPCGVTVLIKCDTVTDAQLEVYLLKASVPVGSAKYCVQSGVGTVYLGGSTDMWSTTFTQAEANASTTGVQIKALSGGTADLVQVYDVQIKFHYN